MVFPHHHLFIKKLTLLLHAKNESNNNSIFIEKKLSGGALLLNIYIFGRGNKATVYEKLYRSKEFVNFFLQFKNNEGIDIMILETGGILIIGVCIIVSIVVQLNWFQPPDVLTESGQQNDAEHYSERPSTFRYEMFNFINFFVKERVLI